jgi:glyoxylase-like metal-dependent hydrolase (beta-lactamase superfamily II)
MQISETVALVGGGAYGISHDIDCNVYLIQSGGEAALIDAGCNLDSAKIVRNVLACHAPQLKYIILTHYHADHAAGAQAIHESLGGQVVASAADAPIIEHGSDIELGLDQAKRSGAYPPNYRFSHSHVDLQVQDGETLQVGEILLRTILVPSHTPGSLCISVDAPEGELLFTGDVLFVGGMISLINVEGCELTAYRRNIIRLADARADGLYPGHLLFCVSGGQRHVDSVVAQLQMSRLPRNLISLAV